MSTVDFDDSVSEQSDSQYKILTQISMKLEIVVQEIMG